MRRGEHGSGSISHGNPSNKSANNDQLPNPMLHTPKSSTKNFSKHYDNMTIICAIKLQKACTYIDYFHIRQMKLGCINKGSNSMFYQLSSPVYDTVMEIHITSLRKLGNVALSLPLDII